MKWLILLISIIFIGCSPPTITSNRDRSVNFSEYKTFCFADYSQDKQFVRPDYDNPENRAIIEEVIIKELARHGFANVEQGSDLMVQYDIIITEMVDPRVDSAVIYKPWVSARTDTFNYTEGLLVIRIIDREEDKMIWQGSLSGVLNKKPDSFGKKLDNYVAELFSSLSEQDQ